MNYRKVDFAQCVAADLKSNALPARLEKEEIEKASELIGSDASPPACTASPRAVTVLKQNAANNETVTRGDEFVAWCRTVFKVPD